MWLFVHDVQWPRRPAPRITVNAFCPYECREPPAKRHGVERVLLILQDLASHKLRPMHERRACCC